MEGAVASGERSQCTHSAASSSSFSFSSSSHLPTAQRAPAQLLFYPAAILPVQGWGVRGWSVTGRRHLTWAEPASAWTCLATGSCFGTCISAPHRHLDLAQLTTALSLDFRVSVFIFSWFVFIGVIWSLCLLCILKGLFTSWGYTQKTVTPEAPAHPCLLWHYSQ
jgi:hypothetical protein